MHDEWQTPRRRTPAAQAQPRVNLEVKSSQPPCRYFQKLGACSRGAGCPFKHVKTQQPLGVAKPCRYFADGYCANGDSCLFRHGPAQPAAAPVAAPPRPLPQAQLPEPQPQPPHQETAEEDPQPPHPPLPENEPPPQPPQQHVAPPQLGRGGRGRGRGRGGTSYSAAAGGSDSVSTSFAASSASGVRSPVGVPPTADEAAASAELACGVCLETVLPNGLFGLLSCEHTICLGCIRQWRASHSVSPQVYIYICI